MDLREYVAALRKRWYLLAALTLVGLCLGINRAETTPPVYESTAKAFVSLSSGANTAELVQGSTFTQNLVQSYAALATMPIVLEPVVERLGIPTTAKALAGTVHATAPLDTVIIEIKATSSSPEQSAAVANAVASQLSQTITQLSPQSGENEKVQATVVSPASVPTVPVAPNKRLLVGAGLLAGLVVGVALAVIRGLLDTRLRTARDISQMTDAAILGSIPRIRTGHRAVTVMAPRSSASEAYRRLQTNLQFVDASSPVKSIVVTSSLGSEGKSTTSINLALAIAEKGQRVLLVDADMRRPALAAYCNLEQSAGLTTVLIGKASLDEVVQVWGESSLQVLTLGKRPPNPSQLVGSQRMADLLDEMRAQYDFVVIDAPPLLPVADGAILARLSDGAVVVANCRKIHRQELADALEGLETVGARCLGVVANNVGSSSRTTYYGQPQRRLRLPWRMPSLKGLGGRSGAGSPAPPTEGAGDGPTLQPVPDYDRVR